MKQFLVIAVMILAVNQFSTAQFVFKTPTNYQGLFSHHLSSARAEGMGRTTILLDGIATSIYNPATISPGEEKLDFTANYAKGHPYYPKSYNSFFGVSYRVMPKLVLGVSAFNWIDPDHYWNAVIMGQNVPTDRQSQKMYSITAAYEVIEGLHIGASGVMLRDESVAGTTTNKENIFNLGAIYDRKVDFIKNPLFSNQRLRVAASMINVLMKGQIEERYENLLNYRDFPTIARLGVSYGASIPLKFPLKKKGKFFSSGPEQLDLSLNMQYQDFLKSKENMTDEHTINTAFGVGVEAWYLKTLAFRLGYYTESRADDPEPGDIYVTAPKKAGFTWGFGANIPINHLSDGSIPFDVELNFVTQKLMQETNKEIMTRYEPTLSNKRMGFCVGMNVRWRGKKD